MNISRYFGLDAEKKNKNKNKYYIFFDVGDL